MLLVCAHAGARRKAGLADMRFDGVLDGVPEVTIQRSASMESSLKKNRVLDGVCPNRRNLERRIPTI
ncbi:MAG: hypothetical protein CME88_08230 [Hirschia sp.]|nr:hypothetical protein [Hirschia sp.]